LELNSGAEILTTMRARPGSGKRISGASLSVRSVKRASTSLLNSIQQLACSPSNSRHHVAIPIQPHTATRSADLSIARYLGSLGALRTACSMCSRSTSRPLSFSGTFPFLPSTHGCYRSISCARLTSSVASKVPPHDVAPDRRKSTPSIGCTSYKTCRTCGRGVFKRRRSRTGMPGVANADAGPRRGGAVRGSPAASASWSCRRDAIQRSSNYAVHRTGARVARSGR
jgi:hypothetical protein